MTDRSDVPPEENSNDAEIESPVEGPQPDWMRAATSSGESSFDETKAPGWLKAIRAGQGAESQEKKDIASPGEGEAQEKAEDDGMSDLERLLAEEGIDLSSVAERRPEGSQGMSAKEWLISTSDDDLVKKRLDDTPVETSSLDPSTPPPAASDDGMSDIERLLAEEGVDLESVAEERPEGSEGMSAKDWLLSTSDDDLVRKQLDTEPPPETTAASSLESAPPAAISSFDDDKMIVSDDLPDWLRETPAQETEPIEEMSPISEALPSEDSDDKVVVSDDLPDWLQGIPDDEEQTLVETEVPVPEATVTPEDSDDKMVVSDDLPEWLQEVRGDESAQLEPTVPLTGISGDDAEDDKLVISDDLPDWLQDIPEEESTVTEAALSSMPESAAPEDSDDKMVVSDDLPDWLQDVEEEDQTEAPTAILSQESAEREDLPDWLRDVEEESLEETSSISELIASASDEASADEGDLPDWLRNAQADETDEVSLPINEVSHENLPDWLKRVRAEQDEVESLSAAATAEGAVSSSSEPGETDEHSPDWLKETEAQEEALATVDLEADTVTSSSSDILAEEEMPDWLQEVEIEDNDLFEPSEPSPEPFADISVEKEEEAAVEEDTLPDWLQEVQKEAREEMAEAPIETTSSEPALAAVAQDEDNIIDTEDLPDWLKEVEEGVDLSEIEEPEPGDISLPVEAEPAAEALLDSVPEEKSSEFSQEDQIEEELIVEPEVESLESEEEVVPVPSQADTVPTADMPQWLKKLREGDQAEETPAPQPIPTATTTLAAQPPSAPSVASVAVVPETAPLPKPTYDDLPSDVEERLKLAQIAGEDGDIDEVTRIYNSVVVGGTYLDTVIERLQETVKLYPDNAGLYQVMGDAMMRDGRLQSALEAYRTALANL